ncbi:hypothetical protein [Roseitranquillus sediminis]|uniref:hypothetical protein n=1 Tax=Roseitranquillus sediminis TaxID=2809051 RepID=UPI001D0C57BE|nr:hypothetical protein [Roseitranquillus sediminis]MBM9594809.1 hypothetical protein [Roseitranquillus sediminis]
MVVAAARKIFGRAPHAAALSAAAFCAWVAPAAAQAIPPSELAELAMRVCIRATPDASEGVQAEGFEVRSRLGRTVIYAHGAGPTMILTAQPNFFACELRAPQADEAYLPRLLAEIEPAIRRRFGDLEPTALEKGRLWQTNTEDDVLVQIEVAERETGSVAIVASADAAPLTPPQSD